MMDSFASAAWAEIIARAAVSPLGIAALVSLIVGFVVLALVRRNDPPAVRLLAIVILMLFCGGLMGAAIYTVRPTALPATAQAETQKDEPSQQPPAPPSQPPAPTPAPPKQQPSPPPPARVATRTDCGTAWSGWVDVGGSVGNPCPNQCARGAELGQSYRAVGFPPRPQIKHKFQCWRE